MKTLFIGDIQGRPGRQTVENALPDIIHQHKPDLVMANAENLAHGKGVTSSTIKEMQRAGIHFFTSGNHIWGNKEGVRHLDDKKFPVIRPANYPPGVPGRGYEIFEDGMMNRVLVINLIGRVFMHKDYDCPFRCVDQILKDNEHERFAAIFVDFHCEATSEKLALGLYLDGRVSAVIGTHTHVPTADARILPGKTAYMSDAGMVGALNSGIGVREDIVINSFLKQIPVKHEAEDRGDMVFSSALIEVDEKTQKAVNIEHIQKIL